MSNPIISILHPTARVKPSASFPRGWKAACEQFAFAAARPEQIEYILIVHESRWPDFWAEYGGPPPHSDKMHAITHVPGSDRYGAFYVVQNHGRDCVVDQINAGAAVASGELLIGIMDDLEAPEGWDEKLLDLLRSEGRSGRDQRLGEGLGEWIIDLTGESSEWIVYSAMTRKRYERYGYVLHPDFESMYADNYYSEIAHRDGVVINGRHLGFKHNHPVHDPSVQLDEVYRQQNRPQAYAIGQATIGRLLYGTRVLVICLPGESFRYEIAASHSHMQHHVTKDRRFMATQLRAHCTNVYTTRIQLTEQVLAFEPFPDLVLWQDDDNPVMPEQFELLLDGLDRDPDLMVNCGWCWCDNDGELGPDGKPKPWMMSAGRQRENLDCLRFRMEDIQRAAESGNPLITSADLWPDAFWSGFPVVLMRGEVLKRLGWEVFKPMLIPEVKYGFTSEDTSFFLNAHRAGMKCAVDMRVEVPHMKFHAIQPPRLAIARAEGLKVDPVKEPVLGLPELITC